MKPFIVTYVQVIQCRLSQVFLSRGEPLENDIVRACKKKKTIKNGSSKGIRFGNIDLTNSRPVNLQDWLVDWSNVSLLEWLKLYSPKENENSFATKYPLTTLLYKNIYVVFRSFAFFLPLLHVSIEKWEIFNTFCLNFEQIHWLVREGLSGQSFK